MAVPISTTLDSTTSSVDNGNSLESSHNQHSSTVGINIEKLSSNMC